MQVYPALEALASNFLWARNPEINRGFQEALAVTNTFPVCFVFSALQAQSLRSQVFFEWEWQTAGVGSFDSVLESWSPRMSRKVRDAGSGLGHVVSAPRTAK
jgi:hypothetical protein